MNPHFNHSDRHEPHGTIRRVLVDCTFTYGNVDAKAGIPRVVRNVVVSAPRVANELGVCWQSVALRGGRWFPIELHPPSEPVVTDFLGRHVREAIQRSKRRLRKMFVPQTIVRWLTTGISQTMPTLEPKALELGPGDLLVLLDAFWSHPNLDLKKVRDAGASVAVVMYDLTPIQYPQFHLKKTVATFLSRFQDLVPQVDLFVAISRTVAEEVRRYVQSHFTHLRIGSDAFTWFPLGAHLEMARTLGIVRPEVQEVFRGEHRPYLAVGTIEPRKNHKTILDAFDRLWPTSPDLRLCLVGNYGWLSDEIIARVQRHPQFGRQLFWLRGLSDSELDHCYRHSKALVYASFAEGFGLPIAEALQHRLPVLASDIPVHREVGADFCAYFDPHRPESLAERIVEFEQRGEWADVRRPHDYRATEWETSTRCLLAECLARVAPPAHVPAEHDGKPFAAADSLATPTQPASPYPSTASSDFDSPTIGSQSPC